jgi:hypothetical protein
MPLTAVQRALLGSVQLKHYEARVVELVVCRRSLVCGGSLSLRRTLTRSVILKSRLERGNGVAALRFGPDMVVADEIEMEMEEIGGTPKHEDEDEDGAIERSEL